jgi:hypothetical protein
MAIVGAARSGRRRGQSMVEFAICAPIIFALLMGVVNGGLFMYARNTVQRASGVGAITEAAAGTSTTADQTTLAAIRGTGIGTSSLVKVNFVRVEGVTFNTVSNAYDRLTTCPGGTCWEDYSINFQPISWTPPGGCTDYTVAPCMPPWPPASRSVHASNATFIRLTINYTCGFFGMGYSYTSSEVRILRLEPKDL